VRFMLQLPMQMRLWYACFSRLVQNQIKKAKSEMHVHRPFAAPHRSILQAIVSIAFALGI